MATMTEQPSVQPSSQVAVRRRPVKIISILSVVGGVIGAAISFAGWGILLPIAAIVLGLIGRSRENAPKRLWLSGVLLGLAGLVVSVISLFYQYLGLMAVAGLSAG
jgi:hypothetical protein